MTQAIGKGMPTSDRFMTDVLVSVAVVNSHAKTTLQSPFGMAEKMG